MKQRTYLVGPLLLALSAGHIRPAQAQPDPNQVPKGVNPPQAELAPPAFTPGGVLDGWPGGVFGGWIKPGVGMPVTMPQLQAQLLRQEMQASGFTDKAAQDAVVEFMQTQEKARGPLRDKARQVDEAIRNNATTDAQMLTLTNALGIAIEDEKTRSEAALKALDAKIGYTKKPRLEAFLLMRGLLDDTTAYVGNLGSNRAQLELNNIAPIWQLAPPLEFGQRVEGQNAPGALPNGQVIPRYYFAVPGTAAPVLRVPVVPYNGLRAYVLPPGVATTRPIQPLGNDFAVQPPIIPQGDVIAPPVINQNGFVQAPPQQPVPLSQPQ